MEVDMELGEEKSITNAVRGENGAETVRLVEDKPCASKAGHANI